MTALMVPDARTLFERATGRRILVVGDLMLDEWIWGTVTRISPEAPVPVVAVADTIKRVRGDRVVETLDRSTLVAVQTPQAFRARELRLAHASDLDATDDAASDERDGDAGDAWAVYTQLLGVRRDTYMRSDMQGDNGQEEARKRRSTEPKPELAAAQIGGYEGLALRVIDGLSGDRAQDVIVNTLNGISSADMQPDDVIENVFDPTVIVTPLEESLTLTVLEKTMFKPLGVICTYCVGAAPSSAPR